MKKMMIGILCMISCIPVRAQLVDRENVIGEWICTEVLLSPEGDLSDAGMKKAFDTMKQGFTSSRFNFSSANIFTLVLSKDTNPELPTLRHFLNNKKWFFDKEKQKITIGTQEKNLMHIFLKQEGDFLLFALYETPLILKMKKT